MTALSDAELERYARHIVLKEVGGAGQMRIRAAHAVVIGAGGIGAPVIQYLAAAGIGTLAVIDDDMVALSNLQRQTIFTTADIGRAKVNAAAGAVARLNPHVRFAGHRTRLDAGNATALLAGASVVIDGCDNFATRLAVADAAAALHVPLVSAAVGQFEGQIAVYRPWEPGRPCYRCLVGNDPDRPEASCAEAGVLGALTGMIGSLAALEGLRAITPFGEDPVGKLMLVDLLAFRIRTIAVPKDPGCRCAG